MIGPKNAPTFDVPLFWMTNRNTRIATAIGRIMPLNAGAAIAIPSTAEITDTAGVIMLSA